MPQPKDKTKIQDWKDKISRTLKGRRCCMRTEWKKGHIPHNKGLKGIHYSPKTEFKKGQKPQNYRGGYKICKDGIYVRVGKQKYSYQVNGKQMIVGKYEQLARKKYREAFGKFDKKMIIFHKDGDIYNNEIENLELITRAELLKRNQYHNEKICVSCGKKFMAKSNYVKNCSHKCIKKYAKICNAKWVLNNLEKSRKHKSKYRQKIRENKHINTSQKPLNTIISINTYQNIIK